MFHGVEQLCSDLLNSEAGRLGKEWLLILRNLHPLRTLHIIIPHMIDPRAYRVAPHEAGVVRLQKFGDRCNVLHSRIEPQVIAVWIENDWHPVVDG
jgi:hypothetical protein